MSEKDGYFAIVYLPSPEERYPTVAERFNNQWFLTGVADPIPDWEILVVAQYELPPEVTIAEVQDHCLRNMDHVGTA